ncbi:MAG: hypothetical protein P1P88_26345 [Bacteroidales bacterium]|nr:hypothetical protein [Bacteroidales bacterium]
MDEEESNFICPECKAKNLKITHSLVLGPDYQNDERLLQIIKCTKCGFEGIAIYEESKHGSLDNETWSHVGYKASKETLQQVLVAINTKNTKVDLSLLIQDEFFNLSYTDVS